jgi:hypothetical protein
MVLLEYLKNEKTFEVRMSSIFSKLDGILPLSSAIYMMYSSGFIIKT